MKIIIVDKNNTDSPSFTAYVFKGNLTAHANTEVDAVEHLLKMIKDRDSKWILSSDHLSQNQDVIPPQESTK